MADDPTADKLFGKLAAVLAGGSAIVVGVFVTGVLSCCSRISVGSPAARGMHRVTCSAQMGSPCSMQAWSVTVIVSP